MGRALTCYVVLLFDVRHLSLPPLLEGEEAVGFNRCSSLRFPNTLAEKKSMAVFEDLWAKGLCAVSGSNYGADYVVYDGKSYGGCLF